MEVGCGRDLKQADLDERQRGEFFDVLMHQTDEARTRVREGTKWQGMPLQRPAAAREAARTIRKLLLLRASGTLDVKYA